MTAAYIVAASIVIACCVLGIYHRAFRDNLLQCAAMGVICLALMGRIVDVLDRGYVSSAGVLLVWGLAIYAAGTAQKIILQYGAAEGWPWLQRLQAWHERATDHGAFDSRPHAADEK
jgi:hypothetical protein